MSVERSAKRLVFVSAACAGVCACTLFVDTTGLLSNGHGDAEATDGAADERGVDPKDAGTIPFTPQTRCPRDGGEMANVGTHCVDVVEVSMASYDEFLRSFPDAAAVDTKDQPPSCDFNTDLRRGDALGDPDLTMQPVVQVDWCDAYAFCKWAGKRLCGAIDGGTTPFASFSDPAVSQWHRACSSNGENDWVYGDTYDGTACRGADYQDQSDYVDRSRAAANCHSPIAPFGDVYDLCGNAAEWEDSCETDNGAIARCRTRGGARPDDAGRTRCDTNALERRDTRSLFVGFRCCWP